MVLQFSDHHLSVSPVKVIIFSEIAQIVSALKQKQLHSHFCLSRISWTIRGPTEFIFLACWEFFDVFSCHRSCLANINIHMDFSSTLPLLNGRNAVFPLEQPVESRGITCSYSEISAHPAQSLHAKNWNTAPLLGWCLFFSSGHLLWPASTVTWIGHLWLQSLAWIAAFL